MNNIAIQVDRLSKQYRIGKSREAAGNRPRLQMLTSPFRYLSDSIRQPDQDEILWAVRNISFEVKRGEVIGIIGHNGAGKSTLLKILSRITEPTGGRALIQGRVGSLLEVGTGFHPELTGRENIYLSGAVLGMKRAEINQKFRDIVRFAEIERFLDTPVKRYSSGMYVRLAFSVAAHLEPEVMLVDEVLAVGDAAFQKKCLGKMGDIATEGRTVLFVSHNMVAVQNLCDRVLWLEGGELKLEGPTAQAVSKYFSNTYQSETEKYWPDIHTAPGNDKVRIHSIRIQPQAGYHSNLISMETPLQVVVDYWNMVPDANIHICLHLFNEQQIVVLSTASIDGSETAMDQQLAKGLYRSVCMIPGNLLNEGYHRISLLVLRNTSKIIYKDEHALLFNVLDLGSRAGAWFGKEPGVIRPILPWETEKIEDI